MDSRFFKKSEAYQQRVKEVSPNSDLRHGLPRAFWVGGLICAIGQWVYFAGDKLLMLSKEHNAAFVAIVMVFIGATLTGIGVYDRIGKYAGAGSVVPITGFANSVVAPAMEFKREGYVLGIGAKMFVLAGPVLVYGIGSSIIVGLIAYFIG